MNYTIGQVAKKTGLTTHTLRYYDKEGLLPSLRKNSVGLRNFNEEDLRWLKMLECLKETGMRLKDIKKYIDLAQLGDETLNERMEMILQQKENLLEQQKALDLNLKKIDFKIKYYREALKVGEKNVYKNEAMAKEREKLFQD